MQINFRQQKMDFFQRCIVVACIGMMLPHTGWSEPSQKPLFKKSGRNVAPNIFYTIDDSGSMAWAYAPIDVWKDGENDRNAPYIHWDDALAKAAHTNPCLLLTPDTDSAATEAVLAMKMRSPQENKIYYNPEILYRPWAKGTPYADFSADLFPASSFKSAPMDGQRVATGKSGFSGSVNLDVSYTLTNSDEVRICGGQFGGAPFWSTRSKPANTSNQRTIHPATYYIKNKLTGKFTRYTLTSNYIANQTFPKYPKRTDCTFTPTGSTTAVCTLANEQQNFANWFTYYRTRSLLARGATSLAFSKIEQAVRLGYGQLNGGGSTEAGKANATVSRGVRNFDIGSTARAEFFNWLYAVPRNGGTPLLRAMDDVGRYFSINTSTGPWANDPARTAGNASEVIHKNMASCRRSYHILTTDGYWNYYDDRQQGQNWPQSNVDNNTGPFIDKNENGRTYRYDPKFTNGITTTKSPYADKYSGTLADVALYYWYRDLLPEVNNNVRVKMSQADKLDIDKPYYNASEGIDRGDHAFWQHLTTYTVGLGISGQIQETTKVPPSVEWPRPIEDTKTTVDDLFHAAVNGRGRYLNASDPQEFQTAIEKTLTEIFSAEPANSGIALTSFAVKSGTKRFIPSFSQPDWTGDVVAYPFESSTEIWSASTSLPAASDRRIEIWNGTQAENFNTSLSGGLRSLMGDGSDNLIKFIRGDRSLEGSGYRCRGDLPGAKVCTKARNPNTGGETKIGLFGAVINSSPVLIADNLDMNYQLLPDGEGADYRSYVDLKKSRARKLLAVGANDGMLHILDEATGRELYAFIPQSVAPFLKRLANPNYGVTVTDNSLDTTHHLFVDGKLNEGDVRINGNWTNVLVGTTGGGAKSVFALKFQANSPLSDTASPILWEINDLASSTLENRDKLGYITNGVTTGRMKNGQWVAIFGNGMDSRAGGAYLWIVDIATGKPIRAPIQAGTDTTANGLGPITVVRDANRTIVAAYAGDAKGRLWRFDLEGNSPSSWKTGFGNSPLMTPSVSRPVSTAPLFVTHPKGGLMVMYATGRLYSDSDEVNTDLQSIYGVWDLTPVGKTSLSSNVASPGQLVEHAVNPTATSTNPTLGYTIVPASAEVTYSNAAGIRGWSINQRLAAGERSIFDPFILSSFAVFNTTAPSNSSAGDPCMAVSTRSFLYFLNPLTGKMAPYPLFDTSGDGIVDATDRPVGVVEIASDGGKTEPFKPCFGSKCPCTGVNCDQPSPCGPGTSAYGVLTNKASAITCMASGYNIRTWQQLQNFPKKVRQ